MTAKRQRLEEVSENLRRGYQHHQNYAPPSTLNAAPPDPNNPQQNLREDNSHLAPLPHKSPIQVRPLCKIEIRMRNLNARKQEFEGY